MDREKHEDWYEDGIRYIADTYGLVNQSKKLVEELSELLVALTHSDTEGISEEIADVKIMIDQYVYLTDIEDVVRAVQNIKIKRTLEMIEGEMRPVSSRSQVVAKWSQEGGRKMTNFFQDPYEGESIAYEEIVGWMTKDGLLRIMCDEETQCLRDVVIIPFIAENWGESEYYVRKLMKELQTDGLVKRTHVGGWTLTGKGRQTETYKERFDAADEEIKKCLERR